MGYPSLCLRRALSLGIKVSVMATMYETFGVLSSFQMISKPFLTMNALINFSIEDSVSAKSFLCIP